MREAVQYGEAFKLGLVKDVAGGKYASLDEAGRRNERDPAPCEWIKREGWIVPVNEKNDPFWSEANLRVLNTAVRQLEEGRGVEHELIEG